MTKGEVSVLALIGAGIAVNNVAGAVVAADSQVPIEVTILGVVITPIVTLVGLIFTFIQLSRKVKDVSGQANDLRERVIVIHELTNSTLSKQTTALEVATAQILKMQEQIGSLNDAKVIADRVAAALAERAAAPYDVVEMQRQNALAEGEKVGMEKGIAQERAHGQEVASALAKDPVSRE